MSIDNWKLWIVPFAAWLVVMAWYTGYQSGYEEGHQTAWQMSRPTFLMQDGEMVVSYDSVENRASK